MPKPKATGSHGIRRPGTTSGVAQLEIVSRKRPVASLIPVGADTPAGRGVVSQVFAPAWDRRLPECWWATEELRLRRGTRPYGIWLICGQGAGRLACRFLLGPGVA